MRIELSDRPQWRKYAATAIENIDKERAVRVFKIQQEIDARKSSWWKNMWYHSFDKTFGDTWQLAVAMSLAFETYDVAHRLLKAAGASDTGQIFLTGEEYDDVLSWVETE